MEDLYETLAEAARTRRPAVLCTVVETQGSTPRKPGTKMIVFDDGTIRGTVGGGMFEQAVIARALERIRQRSPELVHFDLREDAAMVCGGNATVFFDPLTTSSPLYIFGSGHIGSALAAMAPRFGFVVTLLGERAAGPGPDPRIGILTGDYPALLESLPLDERSYIVILTSSHETDERLLGACIRRPHRYLGMIGSRQKIAVIRQNLLNAGLATEEELDGVNMPVGIPFHAETPEEIAISILAKLIDEKNSR